MKIKNMVLITVPVLSVGANAMNPEGIPLGSGVSLTPGVKVELSNSDNVYHESDGGQSSRTTLFNPYVGVSADLGGDVVLGGKYSGAIKTVSLDGNTYQDHNLSLNALFLLASKQSLSFEGKYSLVDELLGTGSTEGSEYDVLETLDPSKLTRTELTGSYSLGNRSSTLGFKGDVGFRSLSYSNNEAFTDALARDSSLLGVEFAARLGSVTRAVLDVQYVDTAYKDESASSKDNVLTTGMVGVDWQVSGKTSGGVKVGVQNRSLNDGDSTSATAMDVEVVWTPRSYSSLSLSYKTGTGEVTTNATGASYTKTSDLMFKWVHSYSVKWSNSLKYVRGATAYEGDDVSREDTANVYGYKLMYSPMRILGVYGEVLKVSKYSNAEGYGFDEQVLTVGVDLAI